jgi:hypothetical protein
MPKVYIIVFTDLFGKTYRYQSETQLCGEAYDSVELALQVVREELEKENITLGESSKVIILNTETGNTYSYKIEEIPTRYVFKAS